MTNVETIFINKWYGWFLGRKFPCSVGWGGINQVKTEGDGVTPAGVYRLENILYRADRIPQKDVPQDAMPIRIRHIWSDDPRDPYYNKLLLKDHNRKLSHELMFRTDSLYDLVIPIDYNRHDPEPGKGSAIFLHVWRGPRIPTAGCVAVNRETLLWITSNLTRETHIAIRE